MIGTRRRHQVPCLSSDRFDAGQIGSNDLPEYALSPTNSKSPCPDWDCPKPGRLSGRLPPGQGQDLAHTIAPGDPNTLREGCFRRRRPPQGPQPTGRYEGRDPGRRPPRPPPPDPPGRTAPVRDGGRSRSRRGRTPRAGRFPNTGSRIHPYGQIRGPKSVADRCDLLIWFRDPIIPPRTGPDRARFDQLPHPGRTDPAAKPVPRSPARPSPGGPPLRGLRSRRPAPTNALPGRHPSFRASGQRRGSASPGSGRDVSYTGGTRGTAFGRRPGAKSGQRPGAAAGTGTGSRSRSQEEGPPPALPLPPPPGAGAGPETGGVEAGGWLVAEGAGSEGGGRGAVRVGVGPAGSAVPGPLGGAGRSSPPSPPPPPVPGPGEAPWSRPGVPVRSSGTSDGASGEDGGAEVPRVAGAGDRPPVPGKRFAGPGPPSSWTPTLLPAGPSGSGRDLSPSSPTLMQPATSSTAKGASTAAPNRASARRAPPRPRDRNARGARGARCPRDTRDVRRTRGSRCAHSRCMHWSTSPPSPRTRPRGPSAGRPPPTPAPGEGRPRSGAPALRPTPYVPPGPPRPSGPGLPPRPRPGTRTPPRGRARTRGPGLHP